MPSQCLTIMFVGVSRNDGMDQPQTSDLDKRILSPAIAFSEGRLRHSRRSIRDHST